MFYIRQSWCTFSCPSPLGRAAAAVPCSAGSWKHHALFYLCPCTKGAAPHLVKRGSEAEQKQTVGTAESLWCGTQTQQDAAVAQRCRTEETSPTPPHATEHQSRALSRSCFSRQVTQAGTGEKASSALLRALLHLSMHHPHQALTQMVQQSHDLQRCIRLLFYFGTGYFD